MKTPARSEAFRSLSSLNREFTLSQFIHAEFESRVASTLAEKANEMTSTAFPANPFRYKFNWKLSEFDNVFTSYGIYLRNTYWVFVHTVVEEYLSSCVDLHYRLDNATDPKMHGESELEYVLRIWKIADNAILQKISCTLDFIRLIRNQIIHELGETKRALKDLQRVHGTTLNRQWGARVKYIEFKSFRPECTKADDLIDIFVVTRDCVRFLDKAIMGSVDKSELSILLWNEFMQTLQPQLRGKSLDIIRRKFNTYCRLNYDFKPLEREVV